MAATVEFSETNGDVGAPSTHDAIANMNYGSNDSYEVVPATYPITAGTNSFTKYWRLHVTNMGGSNTINNLQFWKSAGAYVASEGIQCSLRTAGYSAPAYATPTQVTYTDQVMPVANPGAANLGIGGSTGGSITTAPSYSDYVKSQLQTGAGSPPGNVNQKTLSLQYDES